jgi:hypothetical protein
MTHVRIAATAILVFLLSFMAVTGFPALAAPAKCNAELRKCNSHCSLVYESSRANRTCRNRCKDNFYVCKARPS